MVRKEAMDTDISAFSREEVEAAFRHYFMVGPVMEDWIAWSQLFTDDAIYFDNYYGRFHGPKEIEMFLESTMMQGRGRPSTLPITPTQVNHRLYSRHSRSSTTPATVNGSQRRTGGSRPRW